MIDHNLPVRVFKNLKHGCYSILQGGAIRASARQVSLANVEFRVREAGRQRMLREEQPNVHAFAVGHLLDYVHPDDPRELPVLEGRSLFYDPRRFTTFVDRDTHEPVIHAPVVHFAELNVIYSPEIDRDTLAAPTARNNPLPIAA